MSGPGGVNSIAKVAVRRLRHFSMAEVTAFPERYAGQRLSGWPQYMRTDMSICMSSKAYTVSNYRAFASEATVGIRPLTLFFGYNSSGKSALLRWLPLLRDSVERRGPNPLNMASKALRGANFDGLLSKFTSAGALSFSVESSGTVVRFVVRQITEQNRQIVEHLSVSKGGIVISLDWAASTERPSLYKFKDDKLERDVEVKFEGLFPLPSPDDADVNDLANIAHSCVQTWVKDIFWLQANRAVPPRKEVFGGAPGDLTPDGSGVTQMLFEEDGKESDIISALSDWYVEATGHKLVLIRGAFAASELFSFCLEAAGKPVELADTGEGMGQVLPILGLLLLAERGRLGACPTLLFEHPELHLHSAAEPALANLMCRVAASSSAKVVAETHSESFLLALQLAIIEGKLDPKDCAVYWVRQSDGAPASLVSISFDSEGRPEGGAWPPGVFNEKTEQARRVVLARRAKATNAG